MTTVLIGQRLEDTEYTTDKQRLYHTPHLATGRYMSMFYIERGTNGNGNTVVMDRSEAQIVLNELKAYLEV